MKIVDLNISRELSCMEDTNRQRQDKRRIDNDVFFSVIEKAPYGVIVLDKDNNFLYVNPEFTKITGYSEEDVPDGLTWLSKAYPDYKYRQKVIDFWLKDVNENGIDRVFDITCKDGTIKSIEFRPFLLGDGRSVTILSDITEKKRSEEALRESEEKYRILFEDSRDAIFINERDGRFIKINKAFLDLFKCSEEDIKNHTAGDTYLNPEDRKVFQKEMETHGAVRDFEVKLKKFDGTVMDCLLTATVRHGPDGGVIGYQGIIRDITEQKRFHEDLAKSYKTMRDIIESAPIGIYIVNEKGDIEFVNPEMLRISGSTKEIFLRINVFRLKSYQKIGLVDRIKRCISGEYFRMDSIEYTSYYGKVTTVRNIIGIPFEEAGSKKALIFVEDITKQKLNELQLAYLATHDALTGLPNRNLFNDRLQLAIASSQRYKYKIAVLLFDLDKFKDVNDTHGHKVGDELLKAVSDRVSGVLRQSDTLARMGGDEFLVILPNIRRKKDVEMVTEKILDAFKRPFVIDKYTINITTSIGASLYPDDGDESGLLVKYADIAMYEAKKGGRNAYRLFKKAV